MRRDFEAWLSQLRPSIASYDYYIDFNKVCEKVDSIKEELDILSSLVGSANIEADFKNLARRNPEILGCIPILIAVSKKDVDIQDANGRHSYVFDKTLDVDAAARFMKNTGLFEMLATRIKGNLADYVLGVEAGLDSNARKNRGGHLMEDLVESFIKDAGFIRGISYFKEMYASEIENRWNLNLSELSNNGKAEKRFDFVLKTHDMVYGVETNFYTAGGSKLNETSRSYKMLAEEARRIPGFTFIWVTDGSGWRSARKNLEETYDSGCQMYNIAELEKGALKHIYQNVSI